jgi:hypothetical protein
VVAKSVPCTKIASHFIYCAHNGISVILDIANALFQHIGVLDYRDSSLDFDEKRTYVWSLYCKVVSSACSTFFLAAF